MLEKLSNQARFVEMIVSEELVESNCKKADIVQELKFGLFPELASGTHLDYLLGMAIWSLTKDKVCTPCSPVHMFADAFSPLGPPASSNFDPDPEY